MIMAKNKKIEKIRKRFVSNKVIVDSKEVNPETGNMEISIKLDLANGIHQAINNHNGKVIENYGLSHGYIGEKKWRVTSEIKSNKTDHSLCFASKLRRYKHLVAIDTNEVKYFGKIFGQEVKLGLGIAIALMEDEQSEYLQPLSIPFVTTIFPSQPEQQNWIRLIETLKSNCHCMDQRKIGIIVDSDLGNIPDFNNRTKPLLDEYFLPDEYELIFASDKVSDNIFNQMIKLSHRLSTELKPKFVESLKSAEEEK